MPSRKALLIGINYTGSSAALHGCINDAHNVKQRLISDYGYDEGDIRLLADDSDSHRPTRQGILEAIQWLVAGVKSGDRLLFHYSGHGSYVRDRNGDEADGYDEALVPLDYERSGLIVDDDLKRALADTLPAGAKLTCLIDACHSGTALDLRYNYRQKRVIGTLIKNGRRYQRRTWAPVQAEDRKQKETAAQIVMISGCRDNQTSADGWEDGQSIGAMSWALLKVLARQPNLNYKQMVRKVRMLLKSKGYTQVPQLSMGRKISLNERVVL